MGAQETIVDALKARPGLSTREVARELGFDDTTASYHLRRLAREGRVASERVGRRQCWFVTSCGFCPVLRKLVPSLRADGAKRVALELQEGPPTVTALARAADVPVGRARWVMGGLDEAGIVARTTFRRVRLREGADVCVRKAIAGESCPLWGACAMSRRAAGDAGEAHLPEALRQRSMTGS